MKVRSTLRLPREHGAWAMLYVPFVVGALVAAEINLRVVCLFFSTSFLFIARESLLAWWRGRHRGQPQAAALKTLIIYTSLAGLFGLPLVAVYKLYWLVPLGAACGRMNLSTEKRWPGHASCRRIHADSAIPMTTATSDSNQY